MKRFSTSAIVAVVAFAAVSLPSTNAMAPYVKKIPNGDTIGKSAGHKASGEPNQFGMDFAEADHKWTPELCGKTCPERKMTYGRIFGDPCCVWKEGDKAQFPSNSDVSKMPECPAATTAPTPAPEPTTQAPAPSPVPQVVPAPTPAPEEDYQEDVQTDAPSPAPEDSSDDSTVVAEETDDYKNVHKNATTLPHKEDCKIEEDDEEDEEGDYEEGEGEGEGEGEDYENEVEARPVDDYRM